MALKLGIYDIIQGAVTTEKATKLMQKSQKISLRVHPDANKPMVKEAVERAFNVKVEKVNMLVRKGKHRTFKRIASHAKDTKRALITLQPGYSLGLYEQQGAGEYAPSKD